MKKSFFVALFSLCFFMISHAQILNYSLENQSAYDWEFKMGDNNGNAVYYANIPASSAPVTGQFFGFGFDLQFGGQNSLGCSIFETVTGPTGGTGINFFCTVPAAVNYNVVLVQTVPFIVYEMILEFS